MFHILNVISPLFLIIFITAFLQKLTHIGDYWEKALNQFALKIGLPALIFTTLIEVKFSFQSQASLIMVNSAFLTIGLLCAIVIGRVLKMKKRTYSTFFLCFMFGNFAYLGIPVLTQVSGESILPTIGIIIAVYLFWLFAFVISYLNYQNNKNKKYIFQKIIKNLIKNPLFMSVILGLIFSRFNLPTPDILLQSLDIVSNSVTPIVLVVIGLFIGSSKVGEISEWKGVFLFSLSTLIFLPAGLYFGLELFGLSQKLFSSSIIEAAMPLAITPFALADEYKLDKNFIARSIIMSTTFSVITIPFWISIL